MADIDTSPEAVERAARGAWMAHQQTAADTLRALARERNEALAREAVLREAYRKFVAAQKAYDAAIGKGASVEYQSLRASVGTKERLFAALASIPDAAASRGVALVERGRREGIEEAARECDEYAAWRGEFDDGLSGYSDQAVGASECADAIRALATPPAEGAPR